MDLEPKQVVFADLVVGVQLKNNTNQQINPNILEKSPEHMQKIGSPGFLLIYLQWNIMKYQTRSWANQGAERQNVLLHPVQCELLISDAQISAASSWVNLLGCHFLNA